MNFLSNQLTEAIGWTLAHSLWQGSLIAIACAIALSLLNQASAKTRYTLGLGALALLILSSTLTFGYYWQHTACTTSYAEPIAQKILQLPEGNTTFNNLFTESASEDISLHVFKEYFQEHLPLVVTGWLLGVLLFSLRLIGGFALMQRLKYYRNYPAPHPWQAILHELAEKLQIRRKVKLLESAMVNSPMVIGNFKPIILIPIGMATGFTTEQIEAILAHELAHIRRNDYLINIFQHLVETLFFFHPAVWWLSSLVRHERECCCDDIAVKLTNNSVAFAKALTELETLKHSKRTAALALAMKSRSGKLYQRINRIVFQKPRVPAFKEGVLLASVIVATLFFSALQWHDAKGTSNINPVLLSEIPQEIHPTEFIALQDTSKKKQIEFKEGARNFAFTVEGKVYHFILNDDDSIDELYVGGELIDKTEYPNHQTAIKTMMQMVAPTTAAAPTATTEETAISIASPSFVFRTDVNSSIQQSTNGTYTYSTTTEDGAYVFAKLDKDRTIKELYIDGKAATSAQKKEWAPRIAEELEDERQFKFNFKELEERERAIVATLTDVDQTIIAEKIARARALAKSTEEIAKRQKVIILNDEMDEEEKREQLEALEQKLQNLVQQEEEIEQNELERLQQLQEALQQKIELLHEQKHEQNVRFEVYNNSQGASDTQFSMVLNNESLKKLRKELQKDGLIEKGEKFTLNFSEKRIKVNGKKLSEELNAKYRALLEELHLQADFSEKDTENSTTIIIQNDEE